MKASSTSIRRGPCAGIAAALLAAAALAATAQAQQAAPRAEVPDYAAVLGDRQVVKDPVTGVRRGLNQNEVQRRLERAGIQRTEQQRRDSRAVNEAMHAMPATVAEAFRSAKTNAQGILLVKTAREEVEPMVGIIGPAGGMQASHDPADIRRDER